MTDPTMPEAADLHADADPDESDLADVPRVFRHAVCGKTTLATAAHVRRYLRDPYRLDGEVYLVWCSACGKRVKTADCRWTETGESVRSYFRRLVGRAYLASPWGWVGRFLLVYPAAAAVVLGVVVAVFAVKVRDPALTQLAATAGAVLLAAVLAGGFVVRILTYRRCADEYRAGEEP